MVGLGTGFALLRTGGRTHVGGAIVRLTPHDQCLTTSVRKRPS